MDLYAGTLTPQVVDVVDKDEHTIVLTSERGQSGGHTVVFSSVHVWRMQGGRGTRFDAYSDDIYYHFWSEH